MELKLILPSGSFTLSCKPGTNLARLLWFESGLLPPRGLCSGIGHCGQCRVRFHNFLPEPCAAERAVLSQAELEQGLRLACHHTATENLEVELLLSQAELAENTAFSYELSSPSPEAFHSPNTACLAIDVGTTSVAWKVLASGTKAAPAQATMPANRPNSESRANTANPVNGANGANLANRAMPATAQAKLPQPKVLGYGHCLNPQMGAGSDIMARLAVAATPEGAALLQEKMVGLVKNIIDFAKNKGWEIESVCLAANPAMTCLFLGKNCAGLAHAPYELEYSGAAWATLPNLPPLWIPPLLGPFVGGDVSACLCLLRYMPRPFLVADMGTNGEFLLIYDKKIAPEAPAALPADLAADLPNHLPTALATALTPDLANHLTPDLTPDLANHLTPDLTPDLAAAQSTALAESPPFSSSALGTLPPFPVYNHGPLPPLNHLALSLLRQKSKKFEVPSAVPELGILAASVPLGPALEGIGLSCGGLAGPGSVVEFQLGPLGLQAKTLGGGPALSICGVGYLSLIHVLLSVGLIHPDGYFVHQHSQPLAQRMARTLVQVAGMWRLPLPHGLYLSAEDVENVLKVKAAFAVAIHLLLEEAKLSPAQLESVCLAGALGQYSPLHALDTLGFLPGGLSKKCRSLGNSSLEGACQLATSPETRRRLSAQCAEAVVLDLTTNPQFQALFLSQMRWG